MHLLLLLGAFADKIILLLLEEQNTFAQLQVHFDELTMSLH